MRLIALSFFAIAAYVAVDAIAKLAGVGKEPEYSFAGLVMVALSLVVMPALAFFKRRVARRMGSVALKAGMPYTLLGCLDREPFLD